MKKILALVLCACALLGLTACGGKAPAKSADLAALYDTLTASMPQMLPMDETTMLNFQGIEAADCVQVKVAICAEGLRADEIWLIEAKDEAALEKLQALAEARIQAKDEETVSYNPEQNAVVRNAQVFTEGNYLFLLVSPDVDTLKAQVEAALQ
jgi:hypothetical protein